LKEFSIVIDTEGNTTINLKGYERESPKLAAAFEEVLGKVDKVDWNPKAHAHVHAGHGHRH
jgi:hypothetical protein